MKKLIGFGAIAALMLSASCGGDKGVTAVTGFNGLDSFNDSLSYCIGANIAGNFQQNSLDKSFSTKAFDKGMKDGLEEGTELLLAMESMDAVMRQQVMMLRMDTTPVKYTPEAIGGFTSLGSLKDSMSYFLGVNVSGSMKSGGIIDYYSEPSFYKGMEDVLMGKDAKLSDSLGKILFEKISAIETAKIQVEGEEFLNAKSAEADVVTLPSGLRYKILKEGKGAKPTAVDTVLAHYHGTFIDGTVFDSSVERGEPSKFGVTQVIPGWIEALQLMPLGSKWELFIPFDLAYGAGGRPGIPPYSPLVFEVELIEIMKAK
jgi:FKBP-type peptidyl-prolyl cis-trans isomerase FklB